MIEVNETGYLVISGMHAMLEPMLHHVYFIIWLLAVLLTSFGTAVALIHLRKVRSHSALGKKLLADEGLEPITILKPLKGFDAGIDDNLETFLTLDYPRYEVLFSVEDENDPVVPVVKALLLRHRDKDASLKICSANHGPNPKINNLLNVYNRAKYDWVLISDSNTRIDRNGLRVLANQFKNSVAMQTCVIAGEDPKGVGGNLESVFLNTFYARSMLTLNAVGHPVVMGKSMLFKKSVLDRTGGLRALAEHIAEDYAAGRTFHKLGFRVQVSRTPVRQFLGRYSFRTFWSRHVRWGRLRKMQTPGSFVVEPLFSSIFSGILGSIAFAHLYGVRPAVFLLIHFSVWFLCDLLIYTRVIEKPTLRFVPAWILRELLHFPLWVHIALGNTITWRGRTIRLKRPQFHYPQAFTFHGLHEFLRKSHLKKHNREKHA